MKRRALDEIQATPEVFARLRYFLRTRQLLLSLRRARCRSLLSLIRITVCL